MLLINKFTDMELKKKILSPNSLHDDKGCYMRGQYLLQLILDAR